MNKLHTIAIILIVYSMSGCYGSDWKDVGSCSTDFEEQLVHLIDLADAEQVGVEAIHAEFWEGDSIDFKKIIQALRDTSFDCGTSVSDDGLEHQVAATTNWGLGTVVIDPENHAFDLFVENYWLRPDVQDYGQLSEQDITDQLLNAENPSAEYSLLLDQNHWYWQGPKWPVGILMHEGLHLVYDDESDHDFEHGEYELDDVYQSDMACSVEWAFERYHVQEGAAAYDFLESTCWEIEGCR